MTKVLLVDTNFSSVPIYKELCDLGYEVHVAGGNPKDCLAKQVKNYWPINYADIDSLNSLVKAEKFDFTVPGCTDRSYESCCLLPEHLQQGKDSTEVNQILNNKQSFKHWAQIRGLPVAQSQQLTDALRWPLIVKPVDAFSGRGVTVLKSGDSFALSNAIAKAQSASRRAEYLIEDYVEGQLYSHSAFIRKRQIVQDFIVREDCTVNPFVVDTSFVVPDFPSDLLTELRKSIEFIATDLELADGLIHTQLIQNENKIWLIEVTRRCPGDLYSQLIELSTGFSYTKTYVLPFLNKSEYQVDTFDRISPIMRHTITVPSTQNFGHLKFNQPISIEKWVPLSLAGDKLEPSPASRLGVLFCKTKTHEELTALYKTTLERQLYEIAQ